MTHRLIPLLTCLLVVVAVPAAAQPSNSIGLVLGEGASQFRSEGFSDFQLGPSIGVVGTLRLTPVIGLRTGLVYTEKGGAGEQASIDYSNEGGDPFVVGARNPVIISDGDPRAGEEAVVIITDLNVADIDVEATLAVDYLQVPLLVDVYLPVGGAVRPRLSLGGFFSYSMARALDFSLERGYEVARLEGEIQFADGDTDDDLSRYGNTFEPLSNPGSLTQLVGRDIVLDADNAIRSTDYGLSAGAGVEFDVRNQPVAVALRYDYGLATVSDPSGTPAFIDLGDLEAKTSLVTLNVEVRFDWSRE